MTQVLCAVDDRPASADAVRAAIDLCRERGADLTLVGLVRPLTAVVQPAHGELVRRLAHVQEHVLEAIRAAREAGITPTAVYRAGDSREELLLEAASRGASDVLFATARGRLAAALRQGSATTVNHVTVDGAVTQKEAALQIAA
jgi:nucleotide-binding universal stress UspA family protein